MKPIDDDVNPTAEQQEIEKAIASGDRERAMDLIGKRIRKPTAEEFGRLKARAKDLGLI